MVPMKIFVAVVFTKLQRFDSRANVKETYIGTMPLYRSKYITAVYLNVAFIHVTYISCPCNKERRIQRNPCCIPPTCVIFGFHWSFNEWKRNKKSTVNYFRPASKTYNKKQLKSDQNKSKKVTNKIQNSDLKSYFQKFPEERVQFSKLKFNFFLISTGIMRQKLFLVTFVHAALKIKD